MDHDDVYDLIAIGAGPAGESATELASFFGHRCLIVERSAPGGTVTTTGGVPTKTLREASLYYTGFRDREVYGVRLASPPEVMLQSIRARTWSVAETLQRATAAAIRKRGVDYLEGTARLGPNHTITVEAADGGRRTLQALVVLIATGSRPTRPAGAWPAEHPGLCDTDTILKRGHPPRKLLIVGGGAVAVEFATVASALDIGVTIVSRGDRLLTTMDCEISRRLAEALARCQVRFIAGASAKGATAAGDWLHVELTNGETVEVDTVLFAAGRVGNTEALDLDAAGVKTDGRGRVIVDARLRTTADGIYAAGDVVAPTLASTAMEQGRAAVCDAFAIPTREVLDQTPVSAVYGMPEVAGAGLTEEECQARGLDYEVGRCDLATTPRGAIAGHGGLLKLVFLREGRELVGVHCIGDIASELVGVGHMAIRCGASLYTIATMTMNTPTYTYAYKYAAFDGLRRAASEKPSEGVHHGHQSTVAADLQSGPPAP